MPFSVYRAIGEQCISNVPIIKPMLICVLDGSKELGEEELMRCSAGHFVFLTNSPRVMMRNIPGDGTYCALIIEFDYADFDCFSALKSSDLQRHAIAPAHTKPANYVTGRTGEFLENTLLQFVDWVTYAPQELWPIRRQEILLALYHLGFSQIAHFAQPPSLSHHVFALMRRVAVTEISVDTIASMLAMSASTLSRKLHAEGTHFQEIKDQVLLGLGLHLVQTTNHPISHIAEQCGYASSSRFTEKFKLLFQTTPSQLRKSRLG